MLKGIKYVVLTVALTGLALGFTGCKEEKPAAQKMLDDAKKAVDEKAPEVEKAVDQQVPKDHPAH